MTRSVEALVRDIELSEPLPEIMPVDPDGRPAPRAWLLVRLFTEPLGSLLLDLPPAGLSAATLAAAIDARFGPRIRRRAAEAGVRLAGPLGVGGIAARRDVPYLVERDAILRDAPHIAVAICTRNRPAGLRRLLDSVLRSTYPSFRVVVVDNNSDGDDRTAAVVRAAAERGPVSYVREPLVGASHARNRAMRETAGEIVACTDDDAVVDEFWLAEFARALSAHPEADVVSAPIVPAELVTKAQLWFEEFGGLSKGRGFTPYVFSPPYQQDPLYPLPGFGTGANMAWRPGVAESIGGFDLALGPGTPAMGSEDTLAFMQVLRAGGTIVYHPGALVRHYHRRDVDELERQLVGYGTGLTAAYASLVRSQPSVILDLARLAPRALRDLYVGDGLRAGGLSADFPRELMRANRRGMLRGPLAYAKGWRRNAALAHAESGPSGARRDLAGRGRA
jgi:glycosyltransferase involved in cell wall biosynthesis